MTLHSPCRQQHSKCVGLVTQVRNQEAGVPQLVAVSSAVGFGALNLDIHSYSADWLYQAMLFIFSGTIKSQIEQALDSAVHTVGGNGAACCCSARSCGPSGTPPVKTSAHSRYQIVILMCAASGACTLAQKCNTGLACKYRHVCLWVTSILCCSSLLQQLS